MNTSTNISCSANPRQFIPTNINDTIRSWPGRFLDYLNWLDLMTWNIIEKIWMYHFSSVTPCNLILLTICVSDVVVLICVILNYVITVCINTEAKQNIPKLSMSDVVLICVILSYITNLVCYTYFHWFFNPECQHIFGKQTRYIFQSSKTIKTWTTKH